MCKEKEGCLHFKEAYTSASAHSSEIHKYTCGKIRHEHEQPLLILATSMRLSVCPSGLSSDGRISSVLFRPSQKSGNGVEQCVQVAIPDFEEMILIGDGSICSSGGS